ncbi:MAG: pilus assembly protein [Sphingomonadales bacterium]|nr:pilus assembly protein [Sphingomonadales bacterium]
MIARLRQLWRDTAGVALIETAVLAPTLLLMSIGTYQVSMVVARQHELQSAADEAMSIAIGGWSNDDAQISTIKGILQQSARVSADKISIVRMYRCNSDTSYVAAKASCASDAIVSSYLKLKLNDTYTPSWVSFGVGAPINLGVTRMVQVS